MMCAVTEVFLPILNVGMQGATMPMQRMSDLLASTRGADEKMMAAQQVADGLAARFMQVESTANTTRKMQLVSS